MRYAVMLGLYLWIGAAAFAQTTVDLGGIAVDPSSAVGVTADRLSVDQASGAALFEGNVIITQGALRFSANRVEVVYGADQSQISRLVASGEITLATDQAAAEAQQADYDIVSGILALQGDVLLTQGASSIAADQMTINVGDGTAVMEGRVRTTLQQGRN